MKNTASFKYLLTVLIFSVFGTELSFASQAFWQGVSGTSTTTNWSDSANWVGGITPGGNDVIFNGVGSAGVGGQINNVVDQNTTTTSLLYTNASGQFQTTLIPAGVTLTDSGAFKVGYLTNDNYQTSVALTGGGTLIVNGTLFYVGMCGSASGTTGVATNDMSGLSNFVYNSSSGQWVIAESGGGSLTARGTGVLNLAGASNNITVGTINFNTGGGNNIGFHSLIQLGGGTNILNVGTFNICSTKSKFATVRFISSAPASAGLRLRGVNGNTDDNSRANITLGDRNNTGGDITEGDLLLNGHYVDIKAGTLIVGQDHSGGTVAVHGGQGILQFDTGVIDATNVLIGNLTTTDTSASATGLVMVAGSGIFQVGTGNISLANNAGGGTLAMGALIITNGGTVICSNNIVKATTVNTITTITMSNGTLNVGGAVGSASNPIDTFNITNSTLTLAIPNDSSPAVNVSTLNIGGSTNKVNISAINGTIAAYPTVFQVIKYSTANGADVVPFAFVTGTLPSGGYTGFISNDVDNSAVVLVVTGGPAPPRGITWTGRDAHNGNTTTSVWDINGTFDWITNNPTGAVAYNDNGGLGGDVVTFDDTAATSTVTLSATVAPTGITFTNNTLNYTLNDGNSGKALAGDAILIKRGTGKLTLDNSGGVSLTGGIDIEDGGTLQVGNNDANGGVGTGSITDNGALTFNRNNNIVVTGAISGSGSVAQNGTGTLTLSGANTFDGAVTVNTGVLKTGNNSALGTTNNGTTIASGATLDVGWKNLGQEPVTVSGAGTDGNGALINSFGSPIAFSNVNVSRLTFAGNTTVGGAGRIDLRSPTTADSTLASLTMQGGGAFNLTKKGANQLAIVSVTVDTNLADIDIQSGLMSVETGTTGLGNPTNTVTVENGATLGFFNMTNILDKNIVLDGDGLNGNFGALNNFAGNNTVIGPVTLNGAINVNISFRASAGTPVGGSLTLSNIISGAGSLTKNDTNTLVLAGTNSYSGTTTVNDGTLILNGISTDPNNSLTLNKTVSSSSIPVVLGGSGTNMGPVDIEDTFHPGASGHPSTFSLGSGPGNDYPGQSGTLTFNASLSSTPLVIFDLSSSTTVGGGINDLIAIDGDLAGNGTHIKINPLGALNTSSSYTLVTYTGAKNGSFNSTVQAVTPSRYSFSLNQGVSHVITLTVSGGPALLQWNNAAGNGIWDIQSSQNWSNTVTTANDVFYNLDTVSLDDSITNASTPTTSVTLSGTLQPAAITVNSTTNYMITGTGKISGSTGLSKLGSSTLSITATNDFTGNVLIAGGTVVINNAGGTAGNSSLGAISGGTVTITNGGTLDLSGSLAISSLAFTNSSGATKKFFIAGAGVNGNGAIVNYYTNQLNVFQSITLTANATIGGGTRWDMRGNAGITPLLDLNGHTLTKEGTNQISLVSLITTNSGSIVINNGVLSFETQSYFTNSSATITVNSGGALGHFRESGGYFTVPVTLNGGAIKDLNGTPSTTNDSPITLTANSFLDCNVGATSVTRLNGVISESAGSFGLTKTNSNLYMLTATNTYTGNTIIVGGGIMLTNNGSITLSKNIVIGTNTTLSVAGRTDGTFTMTNGQTLQGSGTLSGNLNNVAGSTVSIGAVTTVGKFTVTGNATLSGTTQIKLDKGNATNDVLIVSGGVTFGGTLSLNNLSGTLAAGDQFKIANASTYGGTFANFVPANPNNDPSLIWDQSLLGSGILKVSSSGPGTFSQTPTVTSFSLNGSNVSINGTNGQAGDAYYLLSSTNVALPLSQWTVIATNVVSSVGANGSFTFTGTNVITPNNQQFYILSSTNSNH